MRLAAHLSIPLQTSAASKRKTLCLIHRSFTVMSEEAKRSTPLPGIDHAPDKFTPPPPPPL